MKIVPSLIFTNPIFVSAHFWSKYNQSYIRFHLGLDSRTVEVDANVTRKAKAKIKSRFLVF